MKQYEIRGRQEALLRANSDLEQFAYSASHDLKEPLRNIRIFSELLLREYRHKLDERGANLIDVVGVSALRMDNLLADLLTYLQTNNLPEELPELADANHALQGALSNLHAAICEAHAEITKGEMPCVRIREIHLQLLFQNLVGNAVKYRTEGCPPRVSITASRSGEHWLFLVEDNGIGIAPEYREKVFGIFKRLHSNGQYSGTGIGLAICQRIVERYGGRIWVESAEGHGSKFLFTIPA